MAGILYDNRTVLFGETDELRITEKELIEAIMGQTGAAKEDVTDLVQVLIDGLDAA